MMWSKLQQERKKKQLKNVRKEFIFKYRHCLNTVP